MPQDSVIRLFLAAGLLSVVSACGPSPAPAGSDRPAADPAAAPAPPSPETDRSPATPAPASSGQAPGEQGGAADWRAVASAADAANVDRLDAAWSEALADARAAGVTAELAALGDLVDPSAGQAGRLQPAPGVYRCRTVNLGTRGVAGLAFVQYPWFRCVVSLSPGGDLALTKTTGSQRTRGLLYPDTDRRLVYIGAEAWSSSETGYPSYGQMPERDQVGVFERIGPARWRLVLPWPKQESKLEILELTRA